VDPEVQAKLFRLIDELETDALEAAISEVSPQHMVEMTDQKGYTLIHMACYKNSFLIGQSLIMRAKEGLV